MMKQKIISGILAAMMVISLLSGCGSSGASAQESKESAEASEMPDLMSRYGRPTGDLNADIEMPEPEELTEDEGAELDRAMRDYVPSRKSLMVNRAKNFYYYEQLDPDQQMIYDTIMMLSEDPTDTNNIATISLDVEPDNDYYSNVLQPAYYAALYDHPELFWLYSGVDNYIGTDSLYQNGCYTLYIRFKEPYANYEQDMKTFNKAAGKFLSEIDLTKSEAEIADAIHDKLIDLVTYDRSVAEEHEGEDLSHSAYGALVANSSGVENSCVCDGYAMAYVYLCQQAGLEATFLTGLAGSDEASAGGHAWSMVKVDGKWQEVDACWDDFDDMFEEMESEYKDKTDDESKKIMQAITDKEFTDSIKHYLNRVSTSYITDFSDADTFNYQYDDGTTLPFVTNSVHIRMNDVKSGGVGSILMGMAPTAE